MTSDGVAASRPWCFKWRGRRCCRRWVALLLAAGSTATSGGPRCYQPWAAVLPSGEDDATSSGRRCYRGCRRCYQRHPVLLPAARGVAASGEWWCCRRRAAMLPVADGDAIGAGRRCCRRRAEMLPAAGWCCCKRRCCRRWTAMLPAPSGDAAVGERICYLRGAAVLLARVPMLPAELSSCREGGKRDHGAVVLRKKNRGGCSLVHVFFPWERTRGARSTRGIGSPDPPGDAQHSPIFCGMCKKIIFYALK